MKFAIGSTILRLVALAAAVAPIAGFKTTAQRIVDFKYPVENFTAKTRDGYFLTLFRIPFSPISQNIDILQKPVVFLMHSLLGSSDSWILNGPKNALAYVLADAGYDVWMGNARGNFYSRKHATKSPLQASFWDFTWHEIGKFDLPAMIDLVLAMTGQKSLHYVGYSQGTTVFMVMLASILKYNKKIKTSHLLAPAVYMNHMRSPLAKVLGPLLGTPNSLHISMGKQELLPNSMSFPLFIGRICFQKSILQPICMKALLSLVGWISFHFNFALLPDIIETHPAGCSAAQLIHYLQEYRSGHFRRYDLGNRQNQKTYNATCPPDYLLTNVKPKTPIYLYYSDNDNFAAIRDVRRLADELGNKVRFHHIEYRDWKHFDFLWAREVKDVIYDHIIRRADKYEGK